MRNVLHRPAVAAPTPFGVLLAAGSLVAVAATIVAAAALPPAAADARVAIVAFAVGVFAAATSSAAASLATGSVAFLLALGFLVNRYGELGWHGERTVVHLLLVGVSVAVGLGLRRSGSAGHAVRRARVATVTTRTDSSRRPAAGAAQGRWPVNGRVVGVPDRPRDGPRSAAVSVWMRDHDRAVRVVDQRLAGRTEQ